MSKEYVAFAVMLLGFILPKLGVEVDANALTTTIYTLVMVASGVIGMIARYRKGDINIAGVKL